MSAHAVLNEDWSQYDDRKNRGGSDRNHFACSEAWEVDYLIGKIRKHHPGISEARIRAAITSCCSEISAPRPRAKFVTCVMQKLGL